MSNPVIELQHRARTLLDSWGGYCSAPTFEHFVEFAITLSNLSELLNAQALRGLQRDSKHIEQQALPLFGDDSSHPIAPDQQQALERAVRQLCNDIDEATRPAESSREERRQMGCDNGIADLPTTRDVLLVSSAPEQWAELEAQLGYFGLSTRMSSWQDTPSAREGSPLLLLDLHGLPPPDWSEHIGQLRRRFKSSQLLGLELDPGFEPMHAAIRGGCDACLPAGASTATIVAQILQMNESQEQEPFRVMIVEDSLTASKAIERVLAEQKTVTRCVNAPQTILAELEEFQPDLILMDMNMPNCTGVEASRVIRQFQQYLSIPIIYLSAETDIAQQVEALRLGGDQFLTKPFNPVFLNAVVNSKIERYRALRRSMYNDSLTGLLNHISTKQAVRQALLQTQRSGQPLSLIMLDIDHFKKVNDNYGHPAGDQVIRSLAWLLRQRVRKSDIVGRYGGEEFVVALPNANAVQALRIMDKIRQDFQELKQRYLDAEFHVSFSGGLAASPDLGDVEGLIQAADDALYEAKRGGRNRIVRAEPAATDA